MQKTQVTTLVHLKVWLIVQLSYKLYHTRVPKYGLYITPTMLEKHENYTVLTNLCNLNFKLCKKTNCERHVQTLKTL